MQSNILTKQTPQSTQLKTVLFNGCNFATLVVLVNYSNTSNTEKFRNAKKIHSIEKLRLSECKAHNLSFPAGFHLDIRKQKYSYLLAVESYQFSSTNFLSKYFYYTYYQHVPLVLMF